MVIISNIPSDPLLLFSLKTLRKEKKLVQKISICIVNWKYEQKYQITEASMRRGGIATCYLTIWHLWPLRLEIIVINGPLPSHVLKAFPVARLNFQKWNPDAFLDHVWKSDFVRYRFCFPQSHHMLPIAGEWTHTQDPPPFCTSPKESVSSDTKYHLYFFQRVSELRFKISFVLFPTISDSFANIIVSFSFIQQWEVKDRV